MDFKDTEEIIEAGKKRPKSTLVILIVLLILLGVIAFVTSYSSEKGKRLAIPSNVSQTQSTKERPLQRYETSGSQSPIMPDNKGTVIINGAPQSALTHKQKKQ